MRDGYQRKTKGVFIAREVSRHYVTLDKISIMYVFVGIVKESETCCIYEPVLLII
jgi:hypothetical protein